MAAFAAFIYAVTVAFGSFRLYRQQQLAEQAPGFGDVLLWQGIVYALWVPFAAAVWLLFLRSQKPPAAIGPYLLAGLVAIPIHAVFTTIVDIGFSQPGGADLVALAAERAQLDILSFSALALLAIAAGYRRKAGEEAENASVLAAALETARSRLSELQVKPRSGAERLMVSAGSRRVMVPVDEVEWFGSAGNYVVVNWQGREGLLRQTLQSLEQRLDGGLFARSHRGTIVNLAMVEGAESLSDGSWRLRMASGMELVASRTYRDALLRQLKEPGAGPR